MTNPQIKIQTLASSHAAAMSKVHGAGFADSWSDQAMEDLLAGPHCLGLGAFDLKKSDPQLLGFVLLGIVADEAEILTLVVAQEARRQGIARALLEQAIVSAAASGATSLFLEVSTRNAAALALYASFGFAEAGRRPGYYKSQQGADAVIMALRF